MKKITTLYALAFALLICSCTHDSAPPAPTVCPNDISLPVVFHVLYEQSNDQMQNPQQILFNKHFTALNKFYTGILFENAASTPVNVSFCPAQTDPYGNELPEAGIHRVYYPGSKNMDPSEFLASKHESGSLNNEIFWNPNRYINIWLFEFKRSVEDIENDLLTAGIAYLPFASKEYPFDGLTYDENNIYKSRVPSFMYGIVLNNQLFAQDEGAYTLFHEMGHYLGLHHAYAVEEEPGEAVCADTDDYSDDYCSDTPKYNRSAYDEMIGRLPVEALVMRTSCSGEYFRSVNFMDYFFGDSSTITPEQRDRIEYVLSYSPLMPHTGTRSGQMIPQTADPSEEPTPVFME